MSTKKRNRAMTEIRGRWDNGDTFGSCMGELFGIASALTVLDDVETKLQVSNPVSQPVPDEWDYQHGMSTYADIRENDITTDIFWLDGLENGFVSASEMIDAGNILRRYRDILEVQGRTY